MLVCIAVSSEHGVQHAVCTLELHGGPQVKQPVTAVQLHCKSDRPVTIGIDSRYLSRHAAQFTGVDIVSKLDCQTSARGFDTKGQGARPPLRAIIYFCGSYSVTLEQPIVRNVTLQYDSPGAETAVLAFGSGTSAIIYQGVFSGNNAGSCVFAFQSATVTTDKKTVFEHNKGKYGAAAMAVDNAKLVLKHTSLQDNQATSGGAVFCFNNASVSITSSDLIRNVAKVNGGAVNVNCSNQV